MIRIFVALILASFSVQAAEYKDKSYTFFYESAWKVKKSEFGLILKRDGKVMIGISPSATTQISEEDAKGALSLALPELEVKGPSLFKKRMGRYTDITRYEWRGHNAKFGDYYAFWVAMPIKGAEQAVDGNLVPTAVHISGVIANSPDQMTALEQFENSFKVMPPAPLAKTWQTQFPTPATLIKMPLNKRIAYLEGLRAIIKVIDEQQHKDPKFKYETTENERSIFDYVNLDFFAAAHADSAIPTSPICVFAGNISQITGGKCKNPAKCDLFSDAAKTGPPAAGVVCNAMLFGQNTNTPICVKADGGATQNCFKEGNSVQDIAKNIKESGRFKDYVNSVEKIYKYCQNPLGFQTVVCKNISKRIADLNAALGIDFDKQVSEIKQASAKVNSCTANTGAPVGDGTVLRLEPVAPQASTNTLPRITLPENRYLSAAPRVFNLTAGNGYTLNSDLTAQATQRLGLNLNSSDFNEWIGSPAAFTNARLLSPATNTRLNWAAGRDQFTSIPRSSDAFDQMLARMNPASTIRAQVTETAPALVLNSINCLNASEPMFSFAAPLNRSLAATTSEATTQAPGQTQGEGCQRGSCD